MNAVAAPILYYRGQTTSIWRFASADAQTHFKMPAQMEYWMPVSRLRTLGILVAVTAAAAPIRRMLLATQDGAPILSRPLPDTALLAPEPRFRMRCWWHWGRVSCGSAARSVMSPRGV